MESVSYTHLDVYKRQFKTLTHICERVVVKFVRGCYQRSGRDVVYVSVSYKTGFHFIVYVKWDKVPYTAEFVNVIHNVFLRAVCSDH